MLTQKYKRYVAVSVRAYKCLSTIRSDIYVAMGNMILLVRVSLILDYPRPSTYSGVGAYAYSLVL